MKESVHLVFGTAVHKAIELRNGNVGAAIETFLYMFPKTKIEENELELHEKLVPIGKEMVKVFFGKREFLNSLYGIHNDGQRELWANATLENPLTKQLLNLPMKGKIDELTTADQIIDYKTSKGFYDLKDEKFKYQTKLYALWFWTTYHRLPKGIIYFVLPKNMKVLQSESPIQVIDLKFSVEELAEAWEYTRNILIQIQQREFSAGKCLPYCDHRKLDALLLPKGRQTNEQKQNGNEER